MPGITSITVPPVTDALTTLAMAKAELNLADSDYTNDLYIAGLIERASAVISRYCGRVFGTQTAAETFHLNARNTVDYLRAAAAYPYAVGAHLPLIVTHTPVASLISVVENSVTLTAGTDFEYEPQSGLFHRLHSNYRVAWYLPTVVVTYVSGWVLPQDTGTRTLPADLEEVCLSLIKAAYYARASDPKIIREIVEGVGRTDYSLTSSISAMQLDENGQAQLAPYLQRVW